MLICDVSELETTIAGCGTQGKSACVGSGHSRGGVWQARERYGKQLDVKPPRLCGDPKVFTRASLFSSDLLKINIMSSAFLKFWVPVI